MVKNRVPFIKMNRFLQGLGMPQNIPIHYIYTKHNAYIAPSHKHNNIVCEELVMFPNLQPEIWGHSCEVSGNEKNFDAFKSPRSRPGRILGNITLAHLDPFTTPRMRQKKLVYTKINSTKLQNIAKILQNYNDLSGICTCFFFGHSVVGGLHCRRMPRMMDYQGPAIAQAGPVFLQEIPHGHNQSKECSANPLRAVVAKLKIPISNANLDHLRSTCLVNYKTYTYYNVGYQ